LLRCSGFALASIKPIGQEFSILDARKAR
jgi:hypothetical protein